MTNLPVTNTFRITATFGQQGKYWKNGHKGVDIVCDNKNVYATCDGTVRYIGFDADGWGRYVDVLDDEGNRHIFCHLSYDSVKVVVGEKVNRATVLGIMGTTGNSTGVHLHYQINNPNNIPVNPCNYMGIPNEKGTYNSKDYQIKIGWIEDDLGWKFYSDNGTLAVNSWVKDSVGWCFVGADGYCIKNTWKTDSCGWCYLDENGRVLKSTWKQLDGKWYYFDNDGHAVKGMQSINNKLFYFSEYKFNGIEECQLIVTNSNGEIR